MRMVGPSVAWLSVLIGACTFASPHRRQDAARLRVDFSETAIEPAGISGLTATPDGRLWAIPEERRLLIPLRADTDTVRLAATPVPLLGVEADLDTEALTWVKGSDFVAGTESVGTRTRDRLLWLRVEDGAARVVEELELSYDAWGIRVGDNQGIEGICHTGGNLVVAAESVIVRDGARFAPVARYEIPRKRWHVTLVELTTRTGKMSALACRMRGASLQVYALERHFGIGRVLRFTWDTRAPGPTRIDAALVLDLALHARLLPNFEALAWHGDTLYLLADNDYRGLQGPTMAARVRLP